MDENTVSEVSSNIPPPHKRNMNVIIIVAIVLVMCCLCLVIAGLLYYMGIKGEGPLAILATATPTSTFTSTPTQTSTPTRTPSPTVELSMIGEWDIYFSWGCTGDYSSGVITFSNDNRFMADNNPEWWGTWISIGDYASWTFNDEPQANYTGTMDSSGNYMDGTMDNSYDESGCWYATR